MFSSLKKLFNSDKSQENEIDPDPVAEEVTQEIALLELALGKDPADNTTQKNLMVKYNQAVKIYAASNCYRHRVDAIFVKMDELRNTIRKNI